MSGYTSEIMERFYYSGYKQGFLHGILLSCGIVAAGIAVMVILWVSGLI